MSAVEMNHNPTGIVQAGENGFQYQTVTESDGIGIITRLRETHGDVRGRAFLLNIDDLIERLGAKWEMKQAFVWGYLKTAFEQRFQEPNWCARLNDNTWLAVTVGVGPRTGALKCAEIWNETGQFFVGNVSDVRLPLFEVVVQDANCLKLRLIDLKTYFDRGEDFGAKSEVRPQATSLAPDAKARENLAVGTATAMRRSTTHVPTLTIAGRNLRVACALEPVFELKKLTMIGHRLEPIVIDMAGNSQLDNRAMRALDWADREQIDLANIEQGVNVLRAKAPEQRKMLMIIPLAFSTLASSRGRSKAMTQVAKAVIDLRLKVLFEIRDMDGVPPGRVMEIISMIKPYCMTVVGHVGTDKRAIPRLCQCGLSGVCIEYDGLQRDEMLLRDYLSDLSATAKASVGACMVQGLDNLRQVAVARLAGVSHASVKTSGLMSTGARSRMQPPGSDGQT